MSPFKQEVLYRTSITKSPLRSMRKLVCSETKRLPATMTETAKNGQLRFGKDDYASKFDPQIFLREYANGVNRRAVLHLDLKWIETFASGAVHGERLLEFGCGPSLHYAIPASRRFQEIYMCEYAPQNRQAIQDWIDKRQHANDWTEFFEFVAEKEGEGASYQGIEDRMRKKIMNVLPCDIHKENPFEPTLFEPGFFDCITENFCLGTACETEEEFKAAIKKLSEYIKPGGRLFLIGSIGETYYTVGDETFFYLRTTPQLLEAAFREAKLRDFQLEKVRCGDSKGVSDVDWVYFAGGTKQLNGEEVSE